MTHIKQHIICGICKKLITFEIPKHKKSLDNTLFITKKCIWADSGMIQYIRYINGFTNRPCL
jgi:hypothetical protein